MNQQYRKNSQFYFHEVDNIASESSYKTLKLWEIQDFFMNENENCKNFPVNKKSRYGVVK